MKRKKKGFTLVELLTVLGIIALLVGLLIPTLSLVRNVARETKQRAQLAIIDQALMAFRSDYGDYPESYLDDSVAGNYYCGAHKLAEALLGWDLLGFHPDSEFWALGHVDDGGEYDADNDDNLDDRIGPYLELATANVFRLGDLFSSTGDLASNRYVICDSFGVRPVIIGGETVRAGTPTLYYRANTSSKVISIGPERDRIYNYFDNSDLIQLNDPAVRLDEDFFYSDEFIIDPKVTARPWPYRADSYILISAGVDGLYGTSDDICNFGN